MAIIDSYETINLGKLMATPPTIPQSKTNGAHVQHVLARVAVASSDSDTSQWRVARLPSGSVITRIGVGCSTITGGTSYDLGVARIPSDQGGAVISQTCFANVLNFSTASLFTLDGMENVSLENQLGKELWQIAGLDSDPKRDLDLLLTANTVGTADGVVGFKIEYFIN